ncbi:50S ribosomal protein L21 [Mesoplasma lactucae ATCC 49193]|uniref:Large ribosomal subunit protein bL21 n=1 Tax=Mesoplasma lactucae ATCC 49193 TaxID=81460 RepID=A0A291IRE1_9MOLU|nr:50S ribosomal protein L21 [Mesoplasma lactucae ATCC 49193]ATZ20295.1 50S ribosomal protein L21 [Mesoplasma lactucae ATCC 49193]MCL8216466.1 50S ribosomal protein L21 [Mesoplasma lactucae ATCC 49193]
MFAIIKTGGKQVKVEKGTEIFIEKIVGEENDQVTFDEVLMIDGTVGTPTVKDGVVTGTIVKQGKGKKLRVVRYHPKKNIRKVYGHRQPYTKVRIEEISIGAPKATKAATKPAAAKTAAPKAAKTTDTASKTTTAAKKPAAKKATTAKATTDAKPAAKKPAAKKATTTAKATTAKKTTKETK